MWDVLKPANVVGLILIIFRIGGLFVTSPLFSNKAVPAKIKIAIVLSTALLIFPFVNRSAIPHLTDNITLIVWVMQEVTIGVIIGYAASLVFAAVQMAGEIFGGQVGFSIATIFDPASESSAGVITSLYVMVGALIFLYLNGHHVILTALTKSFDILPLTQGFDVNVGWKLADMVSRLFGIAIQMAAPLLVVITILSIIFGLITKLSPQMNIYMGVGFIVGPIVGMGTLMLCLPLFRVLLTKITGEMGPDLEEVVRQLKGIQ